MQKRNVINHTPTAHAIYKRTILFANIWNLSDYYTFFMREKYVPDTQQLRPFALIYY